MNSAPVLAAVAALLIATGPIRAETIAALAAKAEAAISGGDAIGALEALEAAIQEVWTRSPLVFRKIAFVDSATGYGVYAEREKPVFKPGEPIVIYTEPVGFVYGKNALGGLEVNLTIDFKLASESGEELIVKDDLAQFVYPVRYRSREFHFDLTLHLNVPPGKYVGRFRMRDKHSDKSGTFELAFEVAG